MKKELIVCAFIISIVAMICLWFGGGNNEPTILDVLNENTSYSWEYTEGYKCIGAFDEMYVYETINNEFQLTLYFNNDELINAQIIANDGYEEELEIAMKEIEEALDITFWYTW